MGLKPVMAKTVLKMAMAMAKKTEVKNSFCDVDDFDYCEFIEELLYIIERS